MLHGGESRGYNPNDTMGYKDEKDADKTMRGLQKEALKDVFLDNLKRIDTGEETVDTKSTAVDNGDAYEEMVVEPGVDEAANDNGTEAGDADEAA